VVLKLGHLGKWVRNTLKILKCGAGLKWRRAVGTFLLKNEGVLLGQGGKEPCIQYNEGRLTGFATSCIRAAV